MATRNRAQSMIVQQAVREQSKWLDWSLPTLLVIAILSFLIAYGYRPVVYVDLGSRYDFPFLNLDDSGFHAREFSATNPTQTYEWPAGSDEFVIEEGLNPAYRMVSLTFDAWEPDANFSRRLVAVYANGSRIEDLTDSGDGKVHTMLIPDAIATDSSLTLRVAGIADRNSLDLPPLQAVSVTLSGANTYRWSAGHGVLSFPSLGRGDWQLNLRAAVYHPDNQPTDARILANGTLLGYLPDHGDVRQLQLLIPASVVGDGNLTLEVVSNTYNDPRPLGIALYDVTLTPAGTSVPIAFPPWSMLLPALAIVFAVYGGLRWLRYGAWIAALAGVAIAVSLAWALIVYRYPMGFYLQPLAWLLLISVLLLPLLTRLTDRVFAAVGVPLAPWLRQSLLLIVLVGFWLKAGGLIFPYMRAIDIQWHMDWVRRLLSGQITLAQIYGVDSPLNELTMPVTEWGAERPVIPYSPFFQLFAVSFTIFPWSLETSSNLLSAALDSSRVLLIALIARKAGLSNRVTLLAGLMFAITPVTFLLHAWGNVPTTFGMWWALVATTIILTMYSRLHERGPFILLTLATLACLLFYTVMAAFHMLFVIILIVLVLLMRGRVDRRPLKPLALATGLALLLSLLIYYGQYIMPILTRTVPYFLTIFTEGPQSVGVERPSFGQYLWQFVPHLDYHIWPGDYLYYGLAIPLLLMIPGFVALRKRQPLWIAFLAWFCVAAVFMLVGFRISMVDKQLFYILPPMMICAAIYFDRYWQRGWWGKVFVIVIYLFTFSSAIDLWLIRIARAPVG